MYKSSRRGDKHVTVRQGGTFPELDTSHADTHRADVARKHTVGEAHWVVPV